MTYPLVSVVIPTYNTPSDLFEDCIESVLKQSYNNIEIIIVDDGSKDTCAQKIDITAEKDLRIKVFHKENSGVSAARNFGIEKSSGEYVIFVDADDCVNKFWLEEAINLADKYNADIIYGCVVMCAAQPDNQTKIQPVYKVVEKEELWKVQSAMLSGKFSDLKDLKHFDFGPCAKLFKKSCISDCRFPLNIKISEDQVFNHKVINNINSCVVMDYDAYYYINNECSVSHSYHPDAVDTIEKAMMMIREDISTDVINMYYYRVIADMFNAIQFAYFCEGNNEKGFAEKVAGVKYAKSKPVLADALETIKIKDIGNKGWKLKVILLKYSPILFVVFKNIYRIAKRLLKTE